MPTIECVTKDNKIVDCGPGCCNPVSGPDLNDQESDEKE